MTTSPGRYLPEYASLATAYPEVSAGQISSAGWWRQAAINLDSMYAAHEIKSGAFSKDPALVGMEGTPATDFVVWIPIGQICYMWLSVTLTGLSVTLNGFVPPLHPTTGPAPFQQIGEGTISSGSASHHVSVLWNTATSQAELVFDGGRVIEGAPYTFAAGQTIELACRYRIDPQPKGRLTPGTHAPDYATTVPPETTAETSTAAIHVLDHGAVGDGSTNDTEAIQRALLAAASSGQHIELTPGAVYLVNPDPASGGTIDIPSDVTLHGNGATLQATPIDGDVLTHVVRMNGVSGARIEGPLTIIGERATHTGTAGEHGMGLSFYDTTDCFVSDVVAKDCQGDGFYFGKLSTQNTNLRIVNPVGINNRRQGMSITNVSDCVIVNPEMSGTNGTAPEAGIDIEPNTGYTVENLTIVNPVCTGNAGPGLYLNGAVGTGRKIKIQGGRCDSNGTHGFHFQNSMDDVEVDGLSASENDVNGALLAAGAVGPFRFGVMRDNVTAGIAVSIDVEAIITGGVCIGGVVGLSMDRCDGTRASNVQVHGTSSYSFLVADTTDDVVLRNCSSERSSSTWHFRTTGTVTNVELLDFVAHGAYTIMDPDVYRYTIDGVEHTNIPVSGRPTETYGTAAPTSGTWARADLVWNTAPNASGNVGWVCTIAGSPGTWKTFGTIGA